jgi:hypothetical protein
LTERTCWAKKAKKYALGCNNLQDIVPTLGHG